MLAVKKLLIGSLILTLLFSLSLSSRAAEAIQNPLEWIEKMELTVMGENGSGNLVNRLDQLELAVTGRMKDGNLVERLSRLQTYLYANQPYDISLIYKIQALEWVVFKEAQDGAMKTRTEKMERILLGQSYSGPLNKRLEKLIGQVFTDGAVKGHWVDIPVGSLLKIRLNQSLSSASNQAQDHFQYVVEETVIQNSRVIFLKGTVGTGTLAEVRRPENLGRDAQLMLDFGEIRALDGTPVKVGNGKKAAEINRSRQWAVGASAAGMLAFGPGGILLGLAIRGHEETIPTGTQLYIQVQEPIRIYTINE